MALPAGVRWGDLEFDDVPAPRKKQVAPTPVGKPKLKKSQRALANWKRRAKRRCKYLAVVIAHDMLEQKATSFEANEKKFRDQQVREAKVYAEKLAAAFHAAVMKEASNG
jgi:hypothetical protein